VGGPAPVARPLLLPLRLALCLAALSLLGCTRPAELVFVSDAAATAATVETVLVASIRAPEPGPALYGNRLGERLSFARFEIAVPPAHRMGQADPRPRAPGDRERHFLVAEASRILDERSFVAAINRRLAGHPGPDRPAALFVHGFRNSFADGVLYQAQLQTDFDHHGALVHFAWPATPSTLTYLRDLDRALASRDALARTIDLLAASEADEIILVGTSLGAFLLMEALRTMAMAGPDPVFARIEAVVLVAADIDLDVFRTQVEAVAARGVQTIVVTSRRDRALGLSAALRGTGRRVGSAPPDALAGLPIAIFDVSALPVGDTYRHLLLARSPDLIRLVRSVHQSEDPDARHDAVRRLGAAVRAGAGRRGPAVALRRLPPRSGRLPMRAGSDGRAARALPVARDPVSRLGARFHASRRSRQATLSCDPSRAGAVGRWPFAVREEPG
jgi:esterase/lipase superfamily enzyme